MNNKMMEITETDMESFRKVMGLLPGVGNSNSITVREFANEDEQFVEFNFSNKYLTSVKLTYKHLLKHYSPKRKLNTITAKDAELFIRSLKKKAPCGYIVYVRNIRAGFNRAISWGYIRENPFAKIKLVKRQRNMPAYITQEDLGCICEKIDNKTIRDAVATAFYTGLRLSELIYLRWENVNLKEKILTVGDHIFNTKSRKQRFIPLPDKIIILLKDRKNTKGKREYVFSKNNDKPYSSDCVSKSFKKACKKCGIDERIRFHSLRHSYATYLAQRGVTPFHLKELLGHSSVAVTEIYSHMSIDALKEAVSKFN